MGARWARRRQRPRSGLVWRKHCLRSTLKVLVRAIPRFRHLRSFEEIAPWDDLATVAPGFDQVPAKAARILHTGSAANGDLLCNSGCRLEADVERRGKIEVRMESEIMQVRPPAIGRPMPSAIISRIILLTRGHFCRHVDIRDFGFQAPSRGHMDQLEPGHVIVEIHCRRATAATTAAAAAAARQLCRREGWLRTT